MLPAPSTLKSVLLAGLLLPALGNAAYAPQGGEYPLSGSLPGDQTAPAVTIGVNGGWIAWQDNGFGKSGMGVGVRRLDANLHPVGNVIRVSRAAAPRAQADSEKPAITLLRDGGAAVVWQSGRLGFQDVYVRFLRPDGSIKTDDILVSMPTMAKSSRMTTNVTVLRNNKLKQRNMRIRQTMSSKVDRTGAAAVATLSDGNVVIAYSSARRIESTTQVLGERVRNIGARRITNSVLVTVPSFSESMQDIYFQRYTAEGERIGGEVRANSFVSFNQRAPAVAARADGTFVVVWTSELHGNASDPVTTQYVAHGGISDVAPANQMDIVGRLFGNNGNVLTDEFVVNTAARPCGTPSVAASVNGGFTVVWSQKDSVPRHSLEIMARSYSPSGNPITDAFAVNTRSYGDQFLPRVAASPAGQIVVWTSLAQDGSGEGIYARWLNDGTITSEEFRVNSTTFLRQFHPAVAADSNGRALVVWSSYQTEAAFDLFGQRYSAQ